MAVAAALLCTLAAIGCFVAGAPTHPTLPTMWIAETIDPPEGAGLEAYLFVDNPNEGNPSAMWSNYTDCERLIYDDGTLTRSGRYLLSCDSVDCCKETQDSNQVEFQIPNIHPATRTTVNYLGRKNVTSFDKVIEADAWEWKFGLEHFNAYTNPCPTCVNNVTLVLWEARVLYESAAIQFSNFQGISASAAPAFKKLFQIPDICHDAIPCDSARARGLLKPHRRA
jgi:hypothetical protein